MWPVVVCKWPILAAKDTTRQQKVSEGQQRHTYLWYEQLYVTGLGKPTKLSHFVF